MAKDINIHVKTPGVAQAKAELESLGETTQQAGSQIAGAQRQAAGATAEHTTGLEKQSGMLAKVGSQVKAFVAGWLGLQGVRAIVNFLIEKLERIATLQEQIYQRSVTLGQVGQALEFQTGTRGQQQYWTEQAAAVQKAGGLPVIETAQQMMISMDIAFSAQGGIKNQQILQLAKQLAPFVGAASLGPQEVAKIFEFAGTAGIAPTTEAYKQYFAQLQAAFTASKATNFGEFMVGLQKGGTAYMAMGGTLPEALSAFGGARGVMANEALAATLVEQVARLSAGGYEKPRKAIERAMGVKWPELSMDQRTAALLEYVGRLPEASRSQVLVKQGFPLELTTQIGKMVTPEAIATMTTTRAKVAGAIPGDIDALTGSYLTSELGRERQSQADIALGQTTTGPAFGSWQRRIKKTKAAHEVLVAKGEGRWILDRLEPYVMALEETLHEIQDIPLERLSVEDQERLKMLRANIQQSIANMSPSLTAPFYPRGLAERTGYQYTQELNRLSGIKQASSVVNNNFHTEFHHDMNYYPTVGDNEVGPRVDRSFR